ncbi:MAG: DUF4397 domain-containing protein [Lacibacter sp.]
MRKYLFAEIYYILAVILLLLASCDKNVLNTTEVNRLTNQEAQVKVVFTTAYRSNPSYYIYLNGQRSSSIIGPTSTTAPNITPFPGGGLNTGGGSTADYLRIAAGQSTVSVAVPKKGTVTPEDSLQLATSQNTYESGKKYTLYFADTSTNLTSVLVVDSLNAPDSGFTKFKFVNLMPDVSAGLDLYIGTVKVASAIPYKGVSPSFVVPTNNTSTTWAIRPAGAASTTTALATYASASALANRRVLTVIARGYNAITTASDIRRKTICLVFNQ